MLRIPHDLVQYGLAGCQNDGAVIISPIVRATDILCGTLEPTEGDGALARVAGGDAVDEEIDVHGAVEAEKVQRGLEDADVGFDAEEEDV